MTFNAVTTIILAGGKSTRLGMDKRDIKLEGIHNLLESVVDKLKPISTEVLVVSNTQHAVPAGTRPVLDMKVGAGAMRGLYSGLAASQTERSFVVACDMPFLNVELVKAMLEKTRDYDVLVPRLHPRIWGQGPMLHPLHAVYSKRCMPAIERQSASGEMSIQGVYALVKTEYIDEDEINLIDPQHLSFFNINTPEDLEYAKSLMVNSPGRTPVYNRRAKKVE
jgi:molybdenum cofactor guanylyltransferase